MKQVVNFAITIILGLIVWAVYNTAKPKPIPLPETVEVYLLTDTIPWEKGLVSSNTSYPLMRYDSFETILHASNYRFTGWKYKSSRIQLWTK